MSYHNLSSVNRTLANQIWNAVKADSHLRTIIASENQIIHTLPKGAKPEAAQLLVFPYCINEIAAMRNQPPSASSQPATLMNLKLRYLIVPFTLNGEYDLILLGRIMQLFAEKPVLRGADLQGSLKDGGEELRVTLDDLAMEDFAGLWTALASPYKLSVSYSVFPVKIAASTAPPRSLNVAKDVLPQKRTTKTA